MNLEIYVSTINNESIATDNKSMICDKLTIINQAPNRLDDSYSIENCKAEY